MKEPILLPPNEGPSRKFWKAWKWIGLAFYAAALLFSRWLPGPVVAAASIYGIIVIAHLLWSSFRYLKDRFFWRVRNRLIGSFVFVGVIPLLLLIGVMILSFYILLGQLADQYIERSLQENENMVAGINGELVAQTAASVDPRLFSTRAASVFSYHSAQFPTLAARLLQRLPDGTLHSIAKHDPKSILREISPHPGDKWRGEARSFDGILRDGDQLFFASLRPIPLSTGFYVELEAPLDEFLEVRLQKEKSLYVNFIAHEDTDTAVTGSGAGAATPARDQEPGSQNGAMEERIDQNLQAGRERLIGDSRSMIWWYLQIKGKSYESGAGSTAGYAVFHVPRETVLQTLLGSGDEQSQSLLWILYALAGMFAFAELVSLVIGFTISRRITRSVHDVYQGILALQKGDLSHQIPVRRNDQLGLLAHSFNQMSASIKGLLEEVVEKERLEQELEIAREVQTTLFPKQLPQPPGMVIFGGCKAARMVSGDYYDFIAEDETHLNIVVGDISGKGISAALLMANLQAAMRSHLSSSRNEDPNAAGQLLVNVMTQLNRQIYLNSPPEKYATLFLSRYDANTRLLWYCNAGHLPPIVLSAQGSQTLEATGTVVGMFPDAVYQAGSISVLPGTLLAIFTDGVTEALNKAEEEYGTPQLLEVLRQSSSRTPEEIWHHVIKSVDAWQSDLPQYDDITLIVAKAG
jgi:phosphoserine phosphatase RsbU/P